MWGTGLPVSFSWSSPESQRKEAGGWFYWPAGALDSFVVRVLTCSLLTGRFLQVQPGVPRLAVAPLVPSIGLHKAGWRLLPWRVPDAGGLQQDGSEALPGAPWQSPAPSTHVLGDGESELPLGRQLCEDRGRRQHQRGPREIPTRHGMGGHKKAPQRLPPQGAGLAVVAHGLGQGAGRDGPSF